MKRLFYERPELPKKELGYALSVHPGRHENAPELILDILSAVGAQLDRVIICHIERTVFDFDRLVHIASTGCYLEFDLFGMEMPNAFFANLGIDLPDDRTRLEILSRLSRSGRGSQLLLSHDIASKHRLHRFGGHGYDHIARVVVPAMFDQGFTKADVQRLTVDNPRSALQV